MQLHLSIKLDKPITLPVNYNHILQGVIYNAVFANYPNYADQLHDDGEQYGERTYKWFTYGPLSGKCRVRDKKITFYNQITWEIRSSDPMLITILRLYFESHGIVIQSNRIRHVDVTVTNYKVEEGKVRIRMLSPLVAFSTMEDKKHTYYYTPEERGFYELTKLNAYKRYDAIKKRAPGDIEFTPVHVSVSDKVVTRYQGIVVVGWKGIYDLEGDSQLIDFLYQTGLGAKNSQGFGMFGILENE